jgi:hypothetical protein
MACVHCGHSPGKDRLACCCVDLGVHLKPGSGREGLFLWKPKHTILSPTHGLQEGQRWLWTQLPSWGTLAGLVIGKMSLRSYRKGKGRRGQRGLGRIVSQLHPGSCSSRFLPGPGGAHRGWQVEPVMNKTQNSQWFPLSGFLRARGSGIPCPLQKSKAQKG